MNRVEKHNKLFSVETGYLKLELKIAENIIFRENV